MSAEKREIPATALAASSRGVEAPGSGPAGSGQAELEGRPYPVLLIVALVAALLAGIYLVEIRNVVAPLFTDPVGPRAFPTLIAFGMFASAVVMFVEYLQARRSGGREAGLERMSFSWTVPGVIAWTFGYLALFEWLGYVAATALYIIPLMLYFNRRRSILNIVVGVSFCAASYLVLAVLLEAQLPTGTLFSSLFQ